MKKQEVVEIAALVLLILMTFVWLIFGLEWIGRTIDIGSVPIECPARTFWLSG